MERTTKYMQNTVMIDKSGRESKSSVMCMCKRIYVNGEFITCKYTYVWRIYYIPNKTPITVKYFLSINRKVVQISWDSIVSRFYLHLLNCQYHLIFSTLHYKIGKARTLSYAEALIGDWGGGLTGKFDVHKWSLVTS